MARHAETWTARLSVKRQVTAEAGKVRIPAVLTSGDKGRSLWLDLTMAESDSVPKAVAEAVAQGRIEQVRREESEKAWKLRCDGWAKDSRIARQDRRIKELEGRLERVHDLVHPDRPNSTVQPDRPAPAASTSDVAH